MFKFFSFLTLLKSKSKLFVAILFATTFSSYAMENLSDKKEIRVIGDSFEREEKFKDVEFVLPFDSDINVHEKSLSDKLNKKLEELFYKFQLHKKCEKIIKFVCKSELKELLYLEKKDQEFTRLGNKFSLLTASSPDDLAYEAISPSDQYSAFKSQDEVIKSIEKIRDVLNCSPVDLENLLEDATSNLEYRNLVMDMAKHGLALAIKLECLCERDLEAINELQKKLQKL